MFFFLGQWASLIGPLSKGKHWAKDMGQSEVLLGTYSGTHRELEKLIGHLKRTSWEL